MAITSKDITRLRKSITDEVLVEYLQEQDASFRSAVGRVRESSPDMGILEQAKFPETMIDMFYGIEQGKSSLPETTQMAASAMEKEKPSIEDDGSFLGETISNIPGSAMRMGSNVFSAIANPLQTAKAVGSAAVGGVVNLAEAVAGTEDVIDIKSEETASQIGKFFMDRYGSLESAAETLKTDPVGFMADAAGVFGSVAGVAKIAGLNNLSSKASSVSRAIDPITAASKVVKAPVKAASKVAKAIPDRLVSSSLKLKPKDIDKIARKNIAGVRPEEWLLKNTKMGSKGARTVDEIVDMLDSSAKESFSSVNKALSSVKGPIGGQMNTLRIGQALDFVDGFYKNVPGQEKVLASIARLKGRLNNNSITLPEVNQIKRMLDQTDQIFKQNALLRGGPQAQGLSEIRSALKKGIEDAADAHGIKNIKELNKNTQVAIEIKDAIISAANRRTPNNLMKISDFLVGGVSLGAGVDPIAAAGIVVANKAIFRNPRVKTFLARQLSNLSLDDLSAISDLSQGGKMTGAARSAIQKAIAPIEEILKIDGIDVLLGESIILPERSTAQ